MPILQYEGETDAHIEFIKGLFAADMKKNQRRLSRIFKGLRAIMDFIALKPRRFAGKTFKIGESVSGELILAKMQKRLLAMGGLTTLPEKSQNCLKNQGKIKSR